MTLPSAVNNRRRTGAKGEETAAAYLEGLHYQIIHRNWRCRAGELDLIALDPDGVTAFVEVKQAKGAAFGTPESWVGPRKQRQIYRVAQAYLQQHNIYKLKSRFDVIGITFVGDQPQIRHIKGAFIRM
jgi:putative endonuclease